MSAHPILKNNKNLTWYLLVWLGIMASHQANLSWGIGLELKYALSDNIIFNLFLVGLGLSLWYPAKYISFQNHSIVKIFLSHIFGGIFIMAIWLALGYFIINSIIPINESYSSFFISTLPWRYLVGVLYYFIFTAFYYVIIYYSDYQERTVRESELRSLITQAELKSLKFQINPHFIFNSLNSMSALTVINPDKARNMILKLADFLRYTLASNERQTTSLSDEIKNIRLYLDIEKVRFEEKFEYVEEINEGCNNIEIPSMILQPLFENTIKHAVYETLDRVVLKLTCKTTDGFLKIVVENNFDEADITKKGAGVGLKNIEERLRLVYHQDSLLDVKREKGLFKVTLFIPLPEK